MKNRLSYCDIIITHAHRYFFSKYNKNCRCNCACKTISPQGTVLRIGFLLTAILSSTSYCMIMCNKHPRADPRTPQTHRVRPRARGSAAREIRPAAEILIRSLSFRNTPKAPPVFRRGFRDFCPVSIPAHSSCSMRENASRNVRLLRTVSCTSGAPSTVTA